MLKQQNRTKAESYWESFALSIVIFRLVEFSKLIILKVVHNGFSAWYSSTVNEIRLIFRLCLVPR